MPWARFGDNSATYPRLMQIAGFPGADARAVNEVRGFINACATQSAGHVTDYLVDFGTAQMFGGARTKKLINWCVRAGLLTEVEVDGIKQWAIINDPEFIHIRTRAEIEWERQQRADTRDTGLMVPVRLRDGDNCRYCGVLVEWRGKKSHKSAEPDHREPGQAATVETLVVSCRRCNGARQDNPQWDDDHPLRPAPVHPNYGRWTATYLTENGYPTRPNVRPDNLEPRTADTAAPARPTDPAPYVEERPAATPADTAPYREERPAGDAAGARPAPQGPSASPSSAEPPVEQPAELVPELGPMSLPRSARSGSAGSGRAGSGSGPGPTPTRRRRRGSRGRSTAPRDASSTTSPHTQPHDQEPDMPTPACCGSPFLAEDSGQRLCLTCGTES